MDHVSFYQKALVVLMTGIISLMLVFFIWLATAIVDVRERTGRIEEKVTSLVETRARNREEASAVTNDRLKSLENKAP